MWFILVFLCAFRTANPLIERRILHSEDSSELNVDSMLNSPEDIESLLDLKESGVATFGDGDSEDTEVGEDFLSGLGDDDDDDDDDDDEVSEADKLLADEDDADQVGQPPEVIEKFGHGGEYDGVNRPGKKHDGERPQDDKESDDELPPTKGKKHIITVTKEKKPAVKEGTAVIVASDVIPNEEEGRGEPKVKKVDTSDDSDEGAAMEMKSHDKESKTEYPKVTELVKKGSTDDDNSKTYKILKPLKIPYSQLPEHIRPPNWMQGFHLVPKEKPMEKADYAKLNFETPVTTHPATPDRVLDVDAPNPAFYTRPPTASPPPRPVVHVHTYKVKPSHALIDLLDSAETTQKPGILPEKFLKYLKAMSQSQQAEFKAALTKSNFKSKKLFATLVQKIIDVSEEGKENDKKKNLRLRDTLDKLEDNMDKRFETFKKEQKAKYSAKLKAARDKIKDMEENQKSLSKQFRNAVVDVKQEVADELASARKAHEQESKAARLERKVLRDKLKALIKIQAAKPVQPEKFPKPKKVKKKDKKALDKDDGSPVVDVHYYLGNGKYNCDSCGSDQCRSACNRCNNCQTKSCRTVCRCGRTYRSNLERLKREVAKLKRTWDKKHRGQQKQLIKVLRNKLKAFRMAFQKAMMASKKPKKSNKFKTLLFGSWAKRSHRRLYRLLEKRGIAPSAKRSVVRIFHRYYHRAMREASNWKDSDKHLSTYLSTVSKIWMKRAQMTLRRANLVKKKRKKKKKKIKKKKKVKKKLKKLGKPVKLPPKPPPAPEIPPTEMPYAERVYKAWRARSQQFMDVHYDSIPSNRRAEVMGYANRIFSLVRKKYIAYLSRDYAPGTRYSRRKRFLDWLVKVSEAVHDYVMKAILGRKFSTGSKSGYLNRIWMKWLKKSKAFVASSMKKINCKGKAQDYISDVFKDAQQAKTNHEAMSSNKATKMKFLKYLVKKSKQLRAKVSFFQKTCKPVKGPRPYVTKMYKRWKRLSGEFVKKNADRMCKNSYRRAVEEHWAKQKDKAADKYLQFLKSEVKQMDASSQSAVSSSDEVAVGDSMEDELGRTDNSFIAHLKKETRSLESFVRNYLRKCGFTIIPRESERTKSNLKKIRAKYKKKMEKLEKPSPEKMIANDKTYGITVGLGNRGNANNIGIGVENMKKDRYGNYQYTPDWKFNKDADFKRSSYDVGLSFDRD